MTLKEKVNEARELAVKIKAVHPTIDTIWFKLEGIPIEEIRAISEETHRDFVVVNSGGKDVLRAQAHSYNDIDIVVFAYSVPVKVITPKVIEAEFIEA